MTLKLAPASADELDSSCASIDGTSDATTSSRELLRLPFSCGRKEVYDEDGALVAVLPANDSLANTNISFSGTSTNIKFGPETHFHDAVTVIFPPSNIPKTQNGTLPDIDRVVCEKEGPANYQLSKRPFYNCQLVIPLTFLLLLLPIPLLLLIFKTRAFNGPPNFPPINPETKNFLEGHPVYSKLNWGALSPKETPPELPSPVPLVIISHSATKSCFTFKTCANQTQDIQWGFQKKYNIDVGYNFLIGGDGGIYEGRGWNLQNSLRAKSLTISFIGDFLVEELRVSAGDAAKVLIKEGVKIAKISADYRLVGENQTSPLSFASPGWNVMKVIRHWDHYYSEILL